MADKGRFVMNPYIIVQGQGWDVRARGFQDRPAVQVWVESSIIPDDTSKPILSVQDDFVMFGMVACSSVVGFLAFAVCMWNRMT